MLIKGLIKMKLKRYENVVALRVFGSDEFNFSFIKKFWDLINKEIIQDVQDFYKSGTILKEFGK